MNEDDRYILLFDGICNLCNNLVQFIIKRDPQCKFKFASLQSESGQSLLRKLKLPTDDFNSFVVIKGDKYWLKSTARLHVLIALGGLWTLVYVLFIFPKLLRDFVYKMVAKTRYKIFGKRDHCMMPTPEIKQRFI